MIVHVNYFLYIFQHWFVAKVVTIQFLTLASNKVNVAWEIQR